MVIWIWNIHFAHEAFTLVLNCIGEIKLYKPLWSDKMGQRMNQVRELFKNIFISKSWIKAAVGLMAQKRLEQFMAVGSVQITTWNSAGGEESSLAKGNNIKQGTEDKTRCHIWAPWWEFLFQKEKAAAGVEFGSGLIICKSNCFLLQVGGLF